MEKNSSHAKSAGLPVEELAGTKKGKRSMDQRNPDSLQALYARRGRKNHRCGL